MWRYALAVLVIAACVPPGQDGECGDNRDCLSPLVCTRDLACLPSDQVRRIQVRWTVRGVAPAAGGCQGIRSFDITFRDPVADQNHAYVPVPCALELFTVDKLSSRFHVVLVNARFEDGAAASASAELVGSDAVVTVDLR